MKREEQIKEYIRSFIEQYAESVDCNPKEVEHIGNFIRIGVNWADRHPKDEVNWADRHPKDEVNWRKVLIQAAISAMQAILGNDTRYKEAVDSWEEDHSFLEAVAKDACIYADVLVEDLKTRVK